MAAAMEAMVSLTAEQVREIMRQLRAAGHAEKAFDVNLAEGRLAETELVRLLGGEAKVEVKRDLMAPTTKRVAIEYRCRGKPSGIATTTAEWWAFHIGSRFFLVRTDELREAARKFYELGYHTKGGDDEAAEMVLMPLNWFAMGVVAE